MKKLTLTIALIASIATVGFTSCSSTGDGENQTAQTEQAGETKGKMELASPAEFKAKMSEFKDYQLIDVRTPGELEGGKIEGSVNIDFHDSAFKEKIAELDKSKPTLVYCAGGVRSAKAAQQMNEMGFTYVIDLDGGYGAWENQ